MGVSASWIALQGQYREAVLETLGLTEIGDSSDCLTGDYACAELPNGWFVIVANDRTFVLSQALKSVSAGRSAIGGEMSETVMVSQLHGYEDGRPSWSVVHDPDVDLEGVEVEGLPPDPFSELQAQLTKQVQAEGTDEVDWMFDLALDLSVAICGFRPDGESRAEWTQLTLKTATPKPRTGKKASLRAEMKKELIPFMLARGWKEQTVFAADSPGNGFDFYRRIGVYNCRFWFDYSSSPDVWVAPGFYIEDFSTEEHRGIVQGGRFYRVPYIPFWKRLLGLEKPPPPPPLPEDPVADQIEKAKALVIDMEAFIDTGEVRPTIELSYRRNATSWPEKHDSPES
ncbi:MAG: hypothetical protein CFE28_04305 [Alphaproteobacteria bacterium PA2]|nr:MAG: hypothetical protein CFE28_04305 [Alphaproteobacteria bacterium PA2]